MAYRINSEGYILDMNGRIDPNKDQSHHAEWKAKLQAAWDKGHPGKTPEPKQTIMVVENGDYQWSIAEDLGADPRKTAYEINGQFFGKNGRNPDLIYKGEIVFVAPTTHYADNRNHTHGRDAKDNGDIFADQTYMNTASGSSAADFTGVRKDVGGFVASLPADPSLHNQALRNMLLYPSWGGASDEGQYGRQITVEEYLKQVPAADRERVANELKVYLGLATKATKDGKVEYHDNDEKAMETAIAADQDMAGVKGDELKAAVTDRMLLLTDINNAVTKVGTA